MHLGRVIIEWNDRSAGQFSLTFPLSISVLLREEVRNSLCFVSEEGGSDSRSHSSFFEHRHFAATLRTVPVPPILRRTTPSSTMKGTVSWRIWTSWLRRRCFSLTHQRKRNLGILFASKPVFFISFDYFAFVSECHGCFLSGLVRLIRLCSLWHFIEQLHSSVAWYAYLELTVKFGINPVLPTLL